MENIENIENDNFKTLEKFANSYMSKIEFIEMLKELDFKAVADFDIELITDFYKELETDQDNNLKEVYHKTGYSLRGC